MKLLWDLIYNDIKKNRVMSVVLTVFLLLSAVLMAGGLRVTGIMLSATKGLNQAAIPPDYLQMHKGDYNAAAVQDFSDTHDYIRDSQVVSMLNINNANLYYQGNSLESCLMDNGFVTQNSRFDYLLDTKQEIAAVQNGEVGVPVYYYEELGIEPGDTLLIQDGAYQKELTVVTLIRDSQMNAALTSSKRFLISEADQHDISSHTGEWEYSLEYLLQPGTDSSVLEKDYIDADMPGNGVAVTGQLLNMLNTLSYGLMAYLLLAASLLLILIALLCLSYIIRATLVEEQRAIGAMKAIGLSVKTIESLYLMKYMVLAGAAGIGGYIAAVPFSDLCSRPVLLYCGTGNTDWRQWVYPLLGILLLELLVIMRCGRMIRKNLKSTVVELLRGEENKRQEGHFRLPMKGWKNRNAVMAFGELSCKWKEYIVLFLVFIFSTFLTLLPINMQTTVNDPSFITYMGVGKCDIRVDMQYSEQLESQKEELLKYLQQDTEIESYVVFRHGTILVQNTEGEWEYLHVSGGDETVFPLNYLEGRTPWQADDDSTDDGSTDDGCTNDEAPDEVAKNQQLEISLSYMEAAELQKKVGDTIRIKTDQTAADYIVSGIYQDITYGGKTAKAQFTFTDEAVEGYTFYMRVAKETDIVEKAAQIREAIPGGRVTPVTEFMEQTLGGITENLGVMIFAATGVSILLIILISTMFLQLITAREHSAVAIKKSLGFTNRDLRIQYGIRILTIQSAAILTGTILTNTAGETLFGALLSSSGAARITMLTNPLISYITCPLLQIAVCIMTVVSATRIIRNYHIRDQIVE